MKQGISKNFFLKKMTKNQNKEIRKYREFTVNLKLFIPELIVFYIFWLNLKKKKI